MPEIKGGKGPMAPQGQAGRARAQAGRGGVWGGAALQAWARGDSYSDMGSFAAAAAAGFNAAAGRDPQPMRGPSPHATRPRAALPPPSPPEKLRRQRGGTATSRDPGPQTHVRGRRGTFLRRERSEP